MIESKQKARIRISKEKWGILKKFLDYSFSIKGEYSLEYGAIGSIKKMGEESYLIKNIYLPESSSDLTQAPSHLIFSANYIRQALVNARKAGANGLVFFHTHPESADSVEFSHYDNIQEPRLIENLWEVWPSSEHMGIVLGRNAMMGRVYKNSNSILKPHQLMVVGNTIEIISLDGHSRIPPEAAGIFDRAMAITGCEALTLIKNLRIVIVGAGGTGSLMTELLWRAGCEDLTVIDFDRVEESDLNRNLHSTWKEVLSEIKKVHVAAKAHQRSGFSGRLTAIDGSIEEQSTHSMLQDSDLIVGCVDRDTPRYILNKLAIESFLPYIDIGTEIGIKKSKVQSMDVRATYTYPGGPCLLCRGIINTDRMRLEGLNSPERDRQLEMGYCEDINLNQPAVMELNMRAASLASLLIRHLFQPFLDQFSNMDFRESLLTLSHRQPRGIKGDNQACGICGFGEKYWMN